MLSKILVEMSAQIKMKLNAAYGTSVTIKIMTVEFKRGLTTFVNDERLERRKTTITTDNIKFCSSNGTGPLN